MSAERYRQAFLATTDAVILSEAESGRILDCNPAALALYGYSHDELCQLLIDDLCVTLLRVHVRKNGETFPVDVSVGHFDDGGLGAAILVVRETSELRRHEQLRTRFIEQVISAQEDERRRIARELHDESGQRLTGLCAGLRLLENAIADEAVRERARRLRRLTEETLDEIERLSRGLHPAVLATLGFEAAVHNYLSEYQRAHGTVVEARLDGFDGAARLPGQVEIALYRILQEALTNVARHAQAESVRLHVRWQRERVELTLIDDGCGFDVAAEAAGGLGLVGIRERIALLRGHGKLESAPGRGTRLKVTVPVGQS